MTEYIVHNLFSTESGVVWLILKWALVVLAAGFIGQFGKAFASYLIRRAAERREKEAELEALRWLGLSIVKAPPLPFPG